MLSYAIAVQAKSKSKAPYNQYDSLQQQGANIHWGNPSDSSAIPSGDFDVVYDNNGKDMDACKPLIDAFKVVTHIATPLGSWHCSLQAMLQHRTPRLVLHASQTLEP